MFYGLGADGTVGANKNTIKIIGEETDLNVQGYFVYDSKKSGAVTISHLRFSKQPIRSTYLISRANFVACHQFSFMERLDVLKAADPGAVFLLNSPFGPDEVWDNLPRSAQETIIKKKLRFYVIDAVEVARAAGMGGRINTVMQTCFFAISGVLPREEAIAAIKHSIEKTYGKRGESVVRKNFAAVDSVARKPARSEGPADDHLEVRDASGGSGQRSRLCAQRRSADDHRRRRPGSGQRHAHRRHLPHRLPRSGRSATSRWKFRCGMRSFASSAASASWFARTPSFAPRFTMPAAINHAPEGFQTAVPKWREFSELKYTLQVAPEDCTGCGLCVAVCPAKSKSEAKHRAINMEPQPPLREKYNEYWDYFLSIPELSREKLSHGQVKDAQLLEPLFEFSGACSGCGETPYISLMTRLFGDRALIANATGCSSIYGGNLPTTPYTRERRRTRPGLVELAV